MSAPCLLENHPGISYLDRDVAASMPHAAICLKYSIAASAVQTHIDTCLASPTQESVINNLAAAARAAQRLLNDAMNASDRDGALKALTQVKNLQETIGKSLGMFRDGPLVDQRTVNVKILKDLS